MKITYIHHSSFLVEMNQVAFLFDYFEGQLPEILDKPLVIFSSHRHGDHFSPVIFELADQAEQVVYVLSDDIWRKRAPQELRRRILFMGPDEEASINLPPAIHVRTMKSTDEGVAFLVECGGKRIYHAGDLNDWVWSGEPEADNLRMSENYNRELEKMKGNHVDVAFVPLDPRQEGDFYRGMDGFMRTVGADVVFPMHFWGDFTVADKLKQLECSADYRGRVMEIHRCGEEFVI